MTLIRRFVKLNGCRNTINRRLGGETAAVEVRHKAADLAALDPQDAHAIVGDAISVRGALGRPLQRRPPPR
jgi:hypothetical protein